MNKTTVQIKGMHCRSCELLVEEEFKEIPGVKKVQVNFKRGEAIVFHEAPSLSDESIGRAVNKAGYEVGSNKPAPWLSQNPQDYHDFFQAAAIVGLVYFIGSVSGVTKFIGGDGLAPTSIPIIFLIGITAGFSTCMALVGGLVLSVSSLFAKKHPYAAAGEKFRPHIAFNIGRVISYFILGGLIGALGGVFQFSSSVLGMVTMGIGLLMVIFGLQLTGIFPRLSQTSLTLPSGISKFLGIHNVKRREYSDVSTALAGATTFFLPCGFTQTMQLFAMGTGSFTSGAMVMGVFSLGTMPGLLGVGGLASYMKGKAAQQFYKLAGVVVVVFALINISRGYNLSGLRTALAQSSSKISISGQSGSNIGGFGNTTAPAKPTTAPAAKKGSDTNAPSGSEQVITAVFKGGYDLTPSDFTVKKGQPVRFIVDAQANGSGCMSAMMIPGLVNRPKYLQKGTKVEFSFTPQKTGEFPITCAMGVPWGAITVQ